MYTHLMEQAVRDARGEPPQVEVEPEIQLGIPAFIPETYVPDVGQRLLVYKRLAAIRSTAELDAVAEELVDRFGPVPPLVVTLLRAMELRRTLKALRVRSARRRGPTERATSCATARGLFARNAERSGAASLLREAQTGLRAREECPAVRDS